MKHVIFFFCFFIILSVTAIAQQPHAPLRDKKFRDKIEQLEKIKLIEILNLDEETTLRFFSRQSAHRDEEIKLINQKEELVDHLKYYFTEGKDLPNGETFESLNKKIIEQEKKMINQRTDFIKSLKDILSEEQISKLIVFESTFRREIRDMILDKRGGGRGKN